MKKKNLLLAILAIALSACNTNFKNQRELDELEFKPTRTSSLSKTTMKGFKTNIEKDALENSDYRKVLYTGEHMQLVLMSLNPGEEIGEVTHSKSDQFFRFESGTGKCIVNSTEYKIKAGDAILVPSGAKHNVINTDTTNALKLYTIYDLPNHRDGVVRNTMGVASKLKEKFDRKTTQ